MIGLTLLGRRALGQNELTIRACAAKGRAFRGLAQSNPAILLQYYLGNVLR